VNQRRLHDEDAAKRFQEALWVHQFAQGLEALVAGRYMAVSLTDGSSDGVAYESRDEAVNKQTSNGDGNRVLYFRIPLERLTIRHVDSLLWYARGTYTAGYRPVGVHERSGGALHIPSTVEDLHPGPRVNRWRALLGPDGRPIDEHRQ